MNVRELAVNTDLSYTSALQAIEAINELEQDSLKKGVTFIEIEFAPDLQVMTAAEHVATKLLKMGIGVRLSLHWPFRGTTAWAIRTDRTRIVNVGVKSGV